MSESSTDDINASIISPGFESIRITGSVLWLMVDLDTLIANFREIGTSRFSVVILFRETNVLV
jgi:hypothetical protein